MNIETILAVAFWAVAILASIWFGWNAVEIFTGVKKEIDDGKDKPPLSWWWQQRWLNFLGSLVGWLALWVLARKYHTCIFGSCSADPNQADIVFSFVAFIGVTGYLPFTVVGILSGMSGLSSKVADLIKELFPKPPNN